MKRTLLSILVCGSFWCSCSFPSFGGDNLVPRIRHPSALVLTNNDTRLLVANSAGGSISVVDVEQGTVVAEVDVGQRLADLVLSPDGQMLVSVDDEARELIVMRHAAEIPEVTARLRLPGAPHSVRFSADGRLCFVAMKWERALAVVDVTAPASPTVIKTVRLSFSPLLQCLVADGTRLVVADAFGGVLATIDVKTLEVIATREIVGHNMRGVALSHDGRNILVAHQVLNSHTETVQRNVFWGAVITNVVRTIPVELFTSQVGEPLPVTGTQTIGGLGAGAGDPAALVVTPSGDTVVALAGVQEIAVRRAGQFGWLRERVGRRPTAIAISSDGTRAFVANTFSDSITPLNLSEVSTESAIKLGPRPGISPVERGRQLFYDARLSYDGWYSCHSCHTDGHSNGLTSDNFGDGLAGAPKRVLSLLGTADTGPWAWDGHVGNLDDQVRSSLAATMRSRNVAAEQITAITAFVRSLPPPPPQETAAADPLVARGLQVFSQSGCAHCHPAPAYTSAASYQVGLTDELGRDRFNPPSLRGVRLRDNLFHDNRAASLDEALGSFAHGQEEGAVSPGDLPALLAFLRSL